MPWFNPYLVSRDANYRAHYDEATKIDAEYVLRKLHEIVERCLQEVKPALHAKTRQPMKDSHGMSGDRWLNKRPPCEALVKLLVRASRQSGSSYCSARSPPPLVASPSRRVFFCTDA